MEILSELISELCSGWDIWVFKMLHFCVDNSKCRHVCKMLQSGTMMVIKHTWIRYESGSFLCANSTQLNCVLLFVELLSRTMIWEPPVFGGFHCSGCWSHHISKAGMCNVCPGNGRESTFVLLVHHSLKRRSVLYKLYFVFLFMFLCIVFPVKFVFTDRFIRKCETVMVAIIFHKCRVEQLFVGNCYKIRFKADTQLCSILGITMNIAQCNTAHQVTYSLWYQIVLYARIHIHKKQISDRHQTPD